MKRSLPIPTLQQVLDFLIEFILILILTISPFLLGSVGAFPRTIIEFGAFLILFLWLFKLVKEGSFEFVSLSINKSIAVFLIYVLLQYLFINFFIYDFTLGEIYRQKIKTEAAGLILCLILFYTVLNNIQGRKKINRLIFSLVCIGFCLSIFGIIQRLSQTEKIFWLIEPKRCESFFASFPNRNHFANYINMIIFLTLGIVFSYFPALRGKMQVFSKQGFVKGMTLSFQKGVWFYVFSLIIMSSSLFYSLSRGGIFSFSLGVIFFLVLILIKGLTKRGYLVLFAILIVTVAMLIWINAPAQLMQRFSSPYGGVVDLKIPLIDRVLGGRKDIINSAVNLIKAYPICGVGFGAFEFIYNKAYKAEPLKAFYVDHVHNDFLELFAGVGFIGFTIFFITACLYLFLIIKTLLKRHDPFAIGVGSGIAAGLFSMCLHSLFDFNFHITSNAVLFFVMAGLAVTVVNSKITEDKIETTLLSKTKPFLVKSGYTKIIISLALFGIFFYIARIIINPYLAYRISIKEKSDISALTKAVRLDPLNDRYHFLLAKLLIAEAGIKKDKHTEYVEFALKETKETIRLNPWNEYYPIYLDWINETFKTEGLDTKNP